MKGTKAAARYAKALLELAIEKNMVDQVAGDMKYMAEVSSENKDFRVFLTSPVIKSDKKIAVLNEVFGEFEDITRQFVNLVTKNRRENLLPEIAHSFDLQVKEYKGIVPVTLISAAPLDASTRDIILSKLGGIVKGELELTEKIDTDLIGGYVVRMGDTRIDASVARQLNDLKQRLTR
jgi:F-type H+-transporting ATPase subunit delta